MKQSNIKKAAVIISENMIKIYNKKHQQRGNIKINNIKISTKIIQSKQAHLFIHSCINKIKYNVCYGSLLSIYLSLLHICIYAGKHMLKLNLHSIIYNY